MRYLGFNVAQADIRTFGDQKALVVERFDRQQGEDGLIYRLTQEDMCQALGRAGQSKYEANGGPGASEIANLLRFSTDSENDMYQFFLAQYVFWLLMGIDGHAKNFSVYLDHTGHWLTPLYDVISAHPFRNQFRRKELRMAMKVMSKNNHYKNFNNTKLPTSRIKNKVAKKLKYLSIRFLIISPNIFSKRANK